MPNQNTTVEEIYELYSKKIETGELSPGQLINENKIANEMEVNRSKVREALNKLIVEGLIEKRANRRKYVSTVYSHDEDELYDFRSTLEAGAVWIIAKNKKDDKIIRELKKLIEDHSYFVEREYWDSIENIERRFHTLMIEQSKNKYIINEYKHSKVTLHIKIHNNEKNKEYEEIIIKEHEEIVRALEEEDVKKASFAVWKHLSRR